MIGLKNTIRNKRFLLMCLGVVALLLPLRAASLAKPSPLYVAASTSEALVSRQRSIEEGNRVLIVNNGYDALLLRVHLIRSATRRIDIQTFIWTADECGSLLMYELIEAAKRGVSVRILADHFVSHKDPNIMAFLATVHPNLKIKHYRPVGKNIKPSKLQVAFKAIFRFKSLNQRMHNKVMIFDDTIALTGGRNIENTYYNHSTGMNFKDRDILVIGGVIGDMRKSFDKFWDYKHSVASSDLKDVAAAIEKNVYKRYETKSAFGFNGFFLTLDQDADDAQLIQRHFVDGLISAHNVEFIADEPGKNRAFWLRGRGKSTKRIRAVIQEARQQLIIQSPYFVLSGHTQEMFKKLRQRRPNLRVTISSNSFGSTDNTAAYSANYRLRPIYIEKLGLHVYEYKPHPADLLKVFSEYPRFEQCAEAAAPDGGGRKPFLCIHAKSFVMDDHITYIGSYNLDPRSANLNTEVGLLIDDPKVAARLKQDILNDCGPGNSWLIAKKQLPLPMSTVNTLMKDLSGLGPFDLWPVQNTTSFELLDGKPPISPDDPSFYNHYRDVGSFPGAESELSSKEIITRLYKAIGGLGTPLL